MWMSGEVAGERIGSILRMTGLPPAVDGMPHLTRIMLERRLDDRGSELCGVHYKTIGAG